MPFDFETLPLEIQERIFAKLSLPDRLGLRHSNRLLRRKIGNFGYLPNRLDSLEAEENGKWLDLQRGNETIRAEAKSYSFQSTSILLDQPIRESTFIYLPPQGTARLFREVLKNLLARSLRLFVDPFQPKNPRSADRLNLKHVENVQLRFPCVDDLPVMLGRLVGSRIERLHIHQDFCCHSEIPPYCACRHFDTEKLSAILCDAKIPSTSTLCFSLRQPRQILLPNGQLVQRKIDFLKLRRDTLDVFMPGVDISACLQKIRNEEASYRFKSLILRPVDQISLDHLKGPETTSFEESKTGIYRIAISSFYLHVERLVEYPEDKEVSKNAQNPEENLLEPEKEHDWAEESEESRIHDDDSESEPDSEDDVVQEEDEDETEVEEGR